MSLKEQTKEIYTHYGLTDEEFEAYKVYLGFTQSTISEVAGILEVDPDKIKAITEKLEGLNFVRKIPGIVDRYIPLEPYLELFNKQSETFREDIGKIKDNVLADQATRFENLEGIEKNAVDTIDTAVKTQVNEFFKDSDNHDVDKKSVIDNARSRFTETSKALEDSIQKTTFAARDRFTETSKTLEKTIQDRLFAGRDRYESTSKTLESDLHTHVDDNYSKFQNHVNTRDAESVAVWDKNTSKFTQDNTQLNTELATTSDAHNKQTKTLEGNLHSVVDKLNTQLKEIAEGFKSKYDGGIQEQKSTLNKIVDDLLQDFATRVQKLEVEMKKDLDAHHEYHQENADNLKPKLDEILEKYMLRMKKVLDELKQTFSGLLNEHVEHVNTTSGSLRDKLNERVSSRHDQLSSQVKAFEDKTIILIDNLKDISDKMTELGDILSKRGSAWKALFLGRHKNWQSLYEEIQERVGKISGGMKSDFTGSTSEYITETGQTTADLKSEVDKVTADENAGLNQQTAALDKKQKEQIDAELEGLASDLSSESYATLDRNVKNTKDVVTKLKDSLENSLHTHHEDYDLALNKHRNTGLKHYDDCNSDVVEKVNSWYSNMDKDHQNAKKDVSNETESQIRDVNEHLKKTQDKNVDHSRTFERDTKDVKDTQRRIFDDFLREVQDDFKGCKSNISEKINNEINLIKDEVKGMDDHQHKVLDDQINLFKDEIAQVDQKQHADIDGQIDLFDKECTETENKLHAMLEDHKAQYNENASNLQTHLTKTVKDNVQSVKDAIADFTLNFMNAIDESNEMAEENEEKLTDVSNAAQEVETLGNSSTWHVYGKKRLLEVIIDAMWRVKSTITIITPEAEPKILEVLSQVAYKKKSARFLYTTSWNVAQYGNILEKMKVLGNIQFRNLKNANDFYAVSRDSEEIVLCPQAPEEKDQIAIVSVQQGYAQIFGSFIYPIFQANSRPL